MIAALAAIAAGAIAQEPPPVSFDETAEQPGTIVDTELTPRPRRGSSWRQIGGAPFGTTTPVEASATSFDEDLYAVSMRNTKLGFAGGAKCRVETAPEDITGCDTVSGDPAVGNRVPVIYRFRQLKSGDRLWERMPLDGDDEPGYVGAIAWIDATTAIAVGGTGTYPRREECADTAAPTCVDPAGEGRAWIYRDERWSELDLSAQRALGMGGLTAVAFNPDVDPRHGAQGAAGGFAQIWEWDGTTFARRIDRRSPSSQIRNRYLFNFRVRAIEARPSSNNHGFVAVTAGCCSALPGHNVPRVLLYGRPDGAQKPLWTVWSGLANGAGGDPLREGDPERIREDVNGQSWDPVRECELRVPRQARETVCPALGPTRGSVGDLARALGDSDGEAIDDSNDERLETRQALPGEETLAGDSFYSAFITRRTTTATSVTVVASAGGAERDGETPSRITAVEPLTPGPSASRTLTLAGTGRLMDAEGDSAGSSYFSTAPMGPDHFPDWAVGETRAARSAFGRRGLIAATHLRPTLTPETVGPPPADTGGVDGYEPTTEGRLDRYLTASTFESTSYSLNSLDVIEQSGAPTGQAWAVGDRGAIVSLNETEVPRPEPDPPELGSRDEGRFPDDGAFRQLTAAPSQPGTVPVAAAQIEAAADRRIRPVDRLLAGRRIVMSRTGDEGWAIGGTGAADWGVSHFDGRSWNVCPPDDHPDPALPRDPACEGVGDLFREAATNDRDPPAARVPFEADEDPSNDDEFEVVAVSGSSFGHEAGWILRYRHGRWRREYNLARDDVRTDGAVAVAFAAPDDGWVMLNRVRNTSNALGENDYRFVHWDGERWTECYRPLADDRNGVDGCDPHDRLPARAEYGTVTDLVGVPGRVYAIGTRQMPRVETGNDTVDRQTRGYTGLVSNYRGLRGMVVYREPGEPWAKDVREGEYDPARTGVDDVDALLEDRPSEERVDGIAVVRRPDGKYEGWVTGIFGSTRHTSWPVSGADVELREPASPLLRLDPGAREWRSATVSEAGPLRDYANGFDSEAERSQTEEIHSIARSSQLAISPADGASSPALITQLGGMVFAWNPARERWEVQRTGRPRAHLLRPKPARFGWATAADGRGGFFLLASSHMFHLSDRAAPPLFTETPLPSSAGTRRIEALTAAPDGTVWAATNSDMVYRYSRVTGWDRVRIPGWDPAGAVTVASPATAIAVNASGEGVVVGAGGRIARVSRGGVALDAAAGTVCDPDAISAPCGTSRDLLAAAVASDGSAIVGGERLALLWRPAGGQFRAISRPDATASANLTAVTMPSPDRAWLTTHTGLIFSGTMVSPGTWTWSLENVTGDGDVIGIGALSEIAVDRHGHGYALGGERVLERAPTGEWRVVDLEATALALPAGDGPGALIGQPDGGIRTLIDGRLEIARPRDVAQRLVGPTGPVGALALLPGSRDGDVEAWAVLDSQPVQRLLHYTSDPEDPLMNPGGRVRPLPDAPADRPGEFAIAAFGKTDCHGGPCWEMTGTSEYSEEVVSRTVDAIAARAERSSVPLMAVSTGDSIDRGGLPGLQVVESLSNYSVASVARGPLNADGIGGAIKLRRWTELVADRLIDADVPVFGAIGTNDLSNTGRARAADNLAWRQTLRNRSAPWGGGDPAIGRSVRYEPVADGEYSQRLPDPEVADPADGGTPRDLATVPAGGAATHYAVDAVRDGQSEAFARLVFVDSSLGTLAQGDPQQQPIEPDGQLRWLERMVCTPGSVPGETCTRRPDQAAIVVSNAPTYSYYPGIGLEGAGDGALIERVLLRHRVTAMIAGKLGWNGLYWATAPGLHSPCVGGRYRTEPPAGPEGCEASFGGQGPPGGPPGSEALTSHLAAGQPAAPPSGHDPTGATEALSAASPTGLLPVAVASGAGGRFGVPDGVARDGFWHGFSVVRVTADGDPRKTVVEQRPLYDWVGIEGQERQLRPGQRMTLRGFARGPMADAVAGGPGPVQIDRIDSDAVTHRYDLMRADPARPWLPLEDANGDYVPLDTRVASVNRETGVVRAGSGVGERMHAIGMLSVGGLAASYPLVFEPRRSFTPARARVTLPTLPRAARAPGAQAPIRLAEVAPPPPSAPPATPGSPLTAQHLQAPTPPALPTLGTANPSGIPPAPSPTPPPARPVAPAPPPVAPVQHAQPLGLGAKVQAVSIVPSVNPPAPPPVNPAPPAGSAARKEAKQRQAAVAKSEEGGDQGAGEGVGIDIGQGERGMNPDGAAATRREQTKPAPATRRAQDRPSGSFTLAGPAEQASAWSRGALYGGGIGLVALSLALGFTILRPRPHERPPRVPAPAWATRVRD